MESTFEDRCIGCLLGTACGDILGAGVEGWSATEIQETFGVLRDFLDTGRGFGCYTDDTQMTLALATSLIERGRVEAEHVSATYAEFYEPWRGYGGGAHQVMRALRRGADYRETGRMQFPEGSFGNGGAMRIAPVGLAYRRAGPDILHQAVEDALVCTHVHPEAVDGAFIQATAVGRAVSTRPSDFHPEEWLGNLHTASRTGVLRAKLEIVARGLREDESDSAVIARLGNGIRASEAVPAALWAFLRYGITPEQCIVRAVGFGGDTDTIGAMAGSLVGALHGTSWIPHRWCDNIDNGEQGRDAIVKLGRALAEVTGA